MVPSNVTGQADPCTTGSPRAPQPPEISPEGGGSYRGDLLNTRGGNRTPISQGMGDFESPRTVSDIAPNRDAPRGIERAAVPDSAETLRTSRGVPPDVSPECAHVVRDWYYAMGSVTPRAYGRCTGCDRDIIVLLPRQSSDWYGAPYEPPAWYARAGNAQAADRRVIVDAAEAVFTSPRFMGQLPRLFDAKPHVLADAMRPAIASRLRQISDDALEARADKLSEADDELTRLALLIDEAHDELSQVRAQIRVQRRELRRVVRDQAETQERLWNAEPLMCAGGEGVSWVYALVASDAPECHRYIGSTSAPLMRYKAHTSKTAAPNVRVWAAECARRGATVQMVCVWQGIGRDAAYEIEARMIGEAKARGMADLNTSTSTQRVA
jgi:hypothetical protein